MNWRSILRSLLPFLAAIIAAIGVGNDSAAATYGIGARVANGGLSAVLALGAAAGSVAIGGGAAAVATGAARRKRLNELLSEAQDYADDPESRAAIATLFTQNMGRDDTVTK